MPSGCLSPEAMERYARKQLSPEEMKLVDEHLASCAFCRDAVEGASQIPDFAAHSAKINERLRRRFRYIPGRSGKSPSLSNFLLPAAASVIVLVGIIAWFHYFYPEKHELAVVSDSISVQADDLEMHEKSDTRTPETGKGEAITIGGIKSRDGDTPAKGIPDKTEAMPVEPGHISAVETAAAENKLIEDTGTEEANSGETIIPDKEIKVTEMKEKASAGATELNTAKKSTIATRQIEINDKAFTTVEQEPEYPGGIDSLRFYLMHSLQYPEHTDHKTDTTVVASFIITKKGKIRDIIIVRSAGKAFDDEAVRVIKLMPEWIPAQQRGKPVAVKYNLPIRFESE